MSSWPVRILLLAAIAVILFKCNSEPPAGQMAAASLETRRTLPAGEVIGSVSSSGAHQWLGIPYAQPPVGELRWRAPQPMQPWPNTFQALQHGSPCPQPVGLNEAAQDVINNVHGDEDCLILDIYAPPLNSAAVQQGGLPVMVWIHGGGNTMGDASTYSAGGLAQSQQLVVVSIQYRLGPLGWFHHDDLHAIDASNADRSGNYGTLDTITALRWVQKNIAGFGGNPNNVTVFGESAGGVNVFALLVSPLAKGLFHRAISQSGIATTTSIEAATKQQRNSSHAVAQKLLQEHQLGTIAALRELAANSLIEAYMATPEDIFLDMPTVLADGHVLPKENIFEVLEQGEFNKVPTILGANRDESKLFLALDPEYVDTKLGFWLSIKNPERYQRDAYYRSGNWRLVGAEAPARAMSTPVFVYRFDWDNLGTPLWMKLPDIFGAAHAFELPFLFPGLNMGPLTDMINRSKDKAGMQKLSAIMQTYWGNFARSGDPNLGQAVPVNWPRWQNGAGEQILVFDDAEGGGTRASADTLTLDKLVIELSQDRSFADSSERCKLYEVLRERNSLMSRHAQALGCGGNADKKVSSAERDQPK